MKVVAAGLLSLLLLGPLAAGSPSASAEGAREIRTVTRAYGDDPVRQARPGERVVVRFEGRRGDRVRLDVSPADDCGSVRLLRGSTRLRADRSGFTRLRRDARHSFVFRPCRRSEVRHELQLTRLRVRPLVTDGPAVRVERRRGYADALRVTVPDDGLAVVRRVRGTGRALRALLPPAGPLERIVHDWPPGGTLLEPLFLRAGRPVEDVYGVRATGSDQAAEPLVAGDRLLLFPALSSTWRSSSPRQQAATLDGDAVRLGTGTVAGRAQQLVFSGDEGDWVRLAAGDGSELTQNWLVEAHRELVAPSGLRLRGPLAGLWRLPETGEYRLTLTPARPVTASGGVRLRTVREVEPVPADGTPARFATTEPGETVVASLALTSADDLYALEADDAAMSGGWVIHAVPVRGVFCGRPPGPNGCWDFVSSVSEDDLVSELWSASQTAYVAVLTPDSDTEGEVTLRVSPRD